jgi:hypothetical protein
MSRLDDELKKAFRREPAPFGFADRVLERVATQNHVAANGNRRHLVRALMEWLGLNSLRVGVVAAAALLLIAIGFGTYRMLRKNPGNGQVAQVRPPDAPPGADPSSKGSDDKVDSSIAVPTPRHTPAPASKGPSRAPAHRIETAPSKEAEAAKEKVLLALHIASSTLGEAQRMVQGTEPGK